MLKTLGKPYHHKDLKRALIEKGIEILHKEGLQSLSLRKVASACGVSHTAPYTHFRSKEELLGAMQDHVTARFSALLEDTIAEHGDEPDALGHLGRVYVLFFIDNPDYFSFLFSQSNVQINLSADDDNASSFRPYDIYKGVAFALLERSGYPADRREDAIIAMWSFVHGLASLATMKNLVFSEDWHDKVGDLLAAFPVLVGPPHDAKKE